MKIAIATLALILPAAPASGQDVYSGLYARDCGDLVCELRIEPAGSDAWQVAWTASDPTVYDATPVCAFSTTATIGTAVMGGVPVGGIAVGRVNGQPFGLFDLVAGERVSISSMWEACPGLAPKGIYESFGDY